MNIRFEGNNGHDADVTRCLQRPKADIRGFWEISRTMHQESTLERIEVPPISSAGRVTVERGGPARIVSIDVLRGLVMAVMALDHTRDFFGTSDFNPRDVMEPALFLTRWVTHFCAPTFIFLAGLSAFLYGRGRRTEELSRFLLIRGLWLMLIDLTLIKFGWRFEVDLYRLSAGIIFVIGASMVALAALVWLPRWAIAGVALIMIGGHNLFDGVRAEELGGASWVWRVLHEPGLVPIGDGLMTAQAFFYNAIFFTYALVLTEFYDIEASRVGWYLLPFAAGNFLGPLLLGRLFDTVGRRPMIATTYALSGLLLALTGALFAAGVLSATSQTVAWTIIFFFASAAASSAYLTVSETFPLEIRALAIAFFFSVGTAIGGIGAPWLFGALIDSGSRMSLLGGYLLGAALMLTAALIAFRFGVAAERKPLEAVATPLSAAD